MFVIAGVTGHVGSVVAQELLSHGEKVRVLVRTAAKGEAWSKKGAEVALATLDDPQSLTSALRGATGFFTLLPPNYQVKGFYAFQRKTAESIAAAVKESRVPHVVMLSSTGGELSEGTGPIKGLHHLENVLRDTGVKLTVIRAGYFQENVGSALAPAKGAGIYPNTMASSDSPTPMIATHDIGELAAFELRMPSGKSEIVDLQGPAYTARQLAEKLGAALGKELKIVDVPPEKQAAAMMQSGMSQEMADIFAEMSAAFATGKIRPVGDRLKLGRTPIDAVIRSLA